MADKLREWYESYQCPKCGATVEVAKGTHPTRVVSCKHCFKSFKLADCTAASSDPKARKTAPAGKAVQEIGAPLFIGAAAISATALIVTYLVHLITDGPAFLVYYGCVFGALYLPLLWLRSSGVDHWFFTLTAAGLFELIGVERIALGSMAGMRHFGFLVFFMFIGGLIFMVRFNKGGHGGHGGHAHSTCGGGCGITTCGGGGGCSAGSGCGGGGGCGGCGGGSS